MNKHSKIIYEQAERFGTLNRINQCVEEMGELTQALCKYRRYADGDVTLIHDRKVAQETITGNICEEIADVEICLKQLKSLLCVTKEVEEIKVQKIERTQKLLDKTKWNYQKNFNEQKCKKSIQKVQKHIIKNRAETTKHRT